MIWMFLLLASPRPHYGGELPIHVYGAPESSAAQATLDRQIFEPLYRRQGDTLVPVLAAGAPSFEDGTLRIPLRREVARHDGQPLTPEALRLALLAWQTRAPHLLWGVQQLGGEYQIRSIDDALLITPAFGPELLLELLASRDALVAIAKDDGWVGTGPFRRQPDQSLVPFEGHRDGAPYLARIRVTHFASKFGAESVAKRLEQGLVFGVGNGSALPIKEWVVLRVGPGADRAALVSAVDAALDRRQMARALGPEATEARTLGRVEAAPRPATMPRQAATLFVSRESPLPLRLLERIEYDLIRAGLAVTIVKLAPDAHRAAQVEGRYELLLDVLQPEPGRPGLLALATDAGLSDLPANAELGRLEAEIQDRAAWVVLAQRPLPSRLVGPLVDVTVEPTGVFDFSNTWLEQQ